MAKGPSATGTDEEALWDYFNLGTKLADLTPLWVAACPHFARIQPLFPGPTWVPGQAGVVSVQGSHDLLVMKPARDAVLKSHKLNT